MGFSDSVLPGFVQFLELLLIAAHAFVALLGIGCVGFLHFFQRNFFGCVICSADLIRALESHVLEHVRQTGLTEGVLHGAGIHVSEESEHRSFGALAEDDGEAVVEFPDRDALLEGSQVLGGGQGNEK